MVFSGVVNYKVRQVLLQSATGITNCEDYYKVPQNNATITELKISFVSVFVRLFVFL